MRASQRDAAKVVQDVSKESLLSHARVTAQSPWPGLEAYDEASSEFFYGRTKEAAELLRLIRLAPLTVIYGKSGLGKTSLLQAGLFPLLRANHYVPVLLRLDFAEGVKNPPLEQVKLHLSESLDCAGAEYPPYTSDESVWEYLHRRDAEFWSADNFPLTPVLVFDQFEELFSRTGGNFELIKQVCFGLADLIENRIPSELANETAGERRSRLDLLSQHYRLVLSFREDFLPEVKTWEKQVPSLLRNYLRLEPMSRQRAIEAVEQGGRTVLEAGVAPYIVDLVGNRDHQSDYNDTSDVVIEPVLLSLCCTQLNRRRVPGARIDKALVETAGPDILESFYRSALEDPEVRGAPDVARFIEDYLIQGDHYRGDYPKQEALDENKLRSGQLDALTDRLRLLRIVHRVDTARVELIHDRLVPVVRKARDQRRIQANQEAQELKAREAQAERDKERARSEELKRQAKRLRRAFAIAAMLAVVAIIAAGLASFAMGKASRSEQKARAETNEAETQRHVAEAQSRVAEGKTIEAAESEQKAKAKAGEAEAQRRVAEGKTIEAAKAGQQARAEAAEAEEQRSIAESKTQEAQVASSARERSELSKGIAVETTRLAEGRLALKVGSEPLEQTMYRALAAYRLSSNQKELAEAKAASLSALELVLDTSGHLSKVVRLQGMMPTPALAFTPDGKTLAVGGEDGSIRLLDSQTYDTIGSLDCEQPSADSVWSLAFNASGTRLAAGYASNSAVGEGLVCTFDVQQRKFLRKWSSKDHGGAPSNVDTVAYGANSGAEFVIFGGSDKMLRKWDLQTGDVVEVKHSALVVGSAITADGGRVATGGDDGIIRIWNLADLGNQTKPPLQLKGHSGIIEQMGFAPGHPNILVSAGDDGRIMAWDIDRGCRTQQSKLQKARIYGIAVGPEGLLASAGADGYVRLFRLLETNMTCPKPKTDSSTHTEVPEFDVIEEGLLSGHGGLILAVAFDREGTHVASAGQDGSIRIWMPNTGSFSLAQLDLGPQPAGSVTAVAVSPDAKSVAAGDDKGYIYLWKIPTKGGEPSREFAASKWKAHEKPIRSLAYVQLGSQLAIVSGGDDGVLKRWDALSQKLIGGELADGATPVLSIAISPDGKTLAAGSDDGKVRLWNAGTGKVARPPIKPPIDTPDFGLSAVGFSNDGRYLAIGSVEYPVLRIVDLKNEHEERMLRGHTQGISAISRGETEWLLSADQDGSILEWEEAALDRPATQGLRKHDEFKYREGFRELRQPQPLTALDTSSDGRLIVTGGSKGQIQLWNSVEHVLISDHFSGNKDKISGDNDKKGGSEEKDKIRAVAVSPSGSFFVTADASTILLWPGPDRWADILCSKLVWNMSQQHWNEWVSAKLPYHEQCPGLPIESVDIPKGLH